MIWIKRFLLLVMVVVNLAGVAWAQTDVTPAETQGTPAAETQAQSGEYSQVGTAGEFGEGSVDFTWLFIKTILAMVVVLALAVLGLRFVLPKLSLHRAPKGSGTMEVIERMPLDHKKSIMILGVEGRRLLVGVTEQELSLLAELQQDEKQERIKS